VSTPRERAASLGFRGTRSIVIVDDTQLHTCSNRRQSCFCVDRIFRRDAIGLPVKSIGLANGFFSAPPIPTELGELASQISSMESVAYEKNNQG
jgi:hypothetical protein